MLLDMDSTKKPETNLNNYFEWMWAEAERLHLNKGSWFRKAEVHQNRWVEFARAAGMSPGGTGRSRDVSAYYFMCLCRGLNLKPEQVEEHSGVKFSANQIAKLKKQAWVDSHDSLVTKLMNLKSEKLKFIEGIIED